jgi:cell division protein FtsB
MNLVGKIFTVFIFLMSVVFATFALAVYSTQTNWKLVADNDKPPEIDKKGLSQRLEKAKKEFEDLQGQKKKLEEQCKVEKDRQDKAQAALVTENEVLRKDRAKGEQEVATLEKGLREAVAAMKAAHETLFNLRAETEQLRKDIMLARDDRDKQFKKVVGLTDDLHNAVAERMRLEKSSADLAAQLAEARMILQYFHLDKTSMAKQPPSDLEGRVVAVKPPDMLEISVGADEGLREGHVLFVIRPGEGGMKYVGKITVMKLSPDRTVCRFDPKQLTVPIERGDLVRAKL